jgi:uncharacterized protein (TIGR02172 family)
MFKYLEGSVNVINKLIAQGRTAEIYEWENGQIIKLYRKGMSNEAVENEYNISKIVQKCGLSVPAVFDKLTVEGRYGIVYEKLSEKTMMKLMTSRTLDASKAARRLAELHYSVHKHKAPGMPSQKNILRESIRRVDLLTEDNKKKIISCLDKLPEESKLCHGDFHPDNILVSEDNAAIIDWMTGSMGTPAADVARTSVMLRVGSMPPGTSPLVKVVVGFQRSKFCKEYIKHYLSISGMSMEEIEAWEAPIAAARLLEWIPKKEKAMLLDIVYKNLRKKI